MLKCVAILGVIEWANWALVLVGALGVLAAFITLRKIGEQTAATKKAAEASLKQANAMVASERAWVVIRSSMKGYTPSTNDDFRYWWSIENTGHTPARILETQCMYELVKATGLYGLPATPKYPEPIELKGFLLPPGRVEEYVTGLRSANSGQWIKEGDLDSTDINVVYMEGYNLRVYGYVKYTDAFGSTQESRFIDYYVWPLDNRPARATGFRPLIGAPPEYTKCT
jgi:hypothetical protein